ncbi:hypothetical protein DL766_001669 [Monosporascus sp. MC13-8B]|uniref:FHA domain-containing protein n=1 Tax=Monosporascus cannonballus TaxID=155416 RepID=A0ABY0H4V0_9PEZI|nr:hypothetical protein DL762_005436 [Monosporascus cannonballus]RYO91908.1 hypothetical protein DL763_004846 [Monosporascus cannonballus]RYP37095.1 hypothetical protein DL766_001669 [Monosporascus sp. MC13-8B]
MWILENEGEAFEGKRLWLRPGKRYLFGRTVAELGQLALKGDPAALKSVSRKHCIIQVDEVAEGDGGRPSSRSRVTVEDLGSKMGTRVNDLKIKGDKFVLTEPVNTLQMGSFQAKFKYCHPYTTYMLSWLAIADQLVRITWFPVVLSYSFTSKELRANPLAKLQQSLEQLDIKYLSEYDNRYTTHIVSKKRNTAKGLRALINGNYIVNDGFVNTILAAAAPENVSDGVERSPLEADFDGNWPDALQFLPPAGDEAAPIPSEEFAPNPARAEIFDGYTFVFYERKQYESLLGAITSGKGKALLKEVVPGETQIDDFIRYVKGVAGEKGLGEFEDGSEGKGVVVVQYMPINSESLDWYSQFYTTVSLRLDQRLVSQRDFLPAIISNDASGLRRPLEEEPEQQRSSQTGQTSTSAPGAMDLDEQQPAEPSQPLLRRRQRGAARSRFRGFGVTLDDEDDPVTAPAPASFAVNPEPSQEEGLFVSQNVGSPELEELMRNTRQSQRKRPAPSVPDPEEVMDGIAPTAAQVKRRRIAAGEDPVPTQRTPTPPPEEPKKLPARTSKIKKEIDVLDLARQHREKAEARAKAEREELARVPEGLDLAEIRRMQIAEPMELRQAPAPGTRTRERDIAEGRWDPAWNGRKNFKKFQQRGAARGRAPQRIIVPIEEVQPKSHGIGDDYWLEDDSQTRAKKMASQQARSHSRSQSTGQGRSQAAGGASHARTSSGASARGLEDSSKRTAAPAPADSSEDEDRDMLDDHDPHALNADRDEDEEDQDLIVNSAPRTRSTRTSTQQTTQRTQRTAGSTPSMQQQRPRTQSSRAAGSASASTGKRPAPASPAAREKPPKRPKIISIGGDSDGDEESEDELRFRFGRR